MIDGEVVAIDAHGTPKSFQFLQNIHRQGAKPAYRAAFVAFDLPRLGDRDLRGRPLSERRAELERLMKGAKAPLLRDRASRPPATATRSGIARTARAGKA